MHYMTSNIAQEIYEFQVVHRDALLVLMEFLLANENDPFPATVQTFPSINAMVSIKSKGFTLFLLSNSQLNMAFSLFLSGL